MGRLLAIGLAMLVAACGGDDLEDITLEAERTNAIGVNGFLWRAALDTMSALPIAQVDSAGGVIVTDWYINPDTPTERLKVTVFIVGKNLRADGVKVAVVRQERFGEVWTNAAVRAGTALQIEDAILTRARQLRIATIDEG